jgi:hypothetical protein
MTGGTTEEERMKCVKAALKAIEVTIYGKITIETLDSDPEGKREMGDGIPHHTLNFDIPVQFGVPARRSCRIHETDADEFVRRVDSELLRLVRPIALTRMALNPQPQSS